MNRGAIIRLAQGLAVQCTCYLGLFLSLAVAARALSPNDFGIYASTVAIASFAGSVLTVGVDRIVLRVLLQSETTSAPEAVNPSLFATAIIINLLIVLGVSIAFALDAISVGPLFVAAMASLAASRLILSGYFKFVANNHANVIATFGLQPLVVAIVFGATLLSAPGTSFVTRTESWMVLTLAVEAIQLVVLYRLARSQGFRFAAWQDGAIRECLMHAKAGVSISVLVLFAQTGLLGLSIATLVLPPAEVGSYTVALRVSQLILFPLIGASQLIIPLSSRRYEAAQATAAKGEIRHILVITNALLLVSNLGFAVIGMLALDLVMHISDPRAYVCTLILNAGNFVTGLFGVGDQIMIAVGRHRQAMWISIWCGGVLFPVLAVAAYLSGYGIVGLAVATALPIALRAIIAYFLACKTVAMPIAVFDRH